MNRILHQSNYPSLVVGSISGRKAWETAVQAEDTPISCDVLELRADTWERDEDISNIATALPRPLPILLTTRHKAEGGMCDMTETQRQELAYSLLPLAAALDWEIAYMKDAHNLLQEAKQKGVIIVASSHNFENTPTLGSMQRQAEKAIELGADVVKFAFRLHHIQDLLVGVQLLQSSSYPMAIMGMGPLGPTSRLIYNQYGSVLTYGYLGNTPTAPGQWSAALCKKALSSLLPAGL